MHWWTGKQGGFIFCERSTLSMNKITVVDGSCIFSSPSIVYVIHSLIDELSSRGCGDISPMLTPGKKSPWAIFFVEGLSCEFTWTYESPTFGTRPMFWDQRCLCRIGDACFFVVFLVTVTITSHLRPRLEHKLFNEILVMMVSPPVVIMKLRGYWLHMVQDLHMWTVGPVDSLYIPKWSQMIYIYIPKTS